MNGTAQFFKVIQARDMAAVKRMLAAEPQLASARNEKGQSALLLAVYSGNQELCDMLLAQGVPLELHEGQLPDREGVRSSAAGAAEIQWSDRDERHGRLSREGSGRAERE